MRKPLFTLSTNRNIKSLSGQLLGSRALLKHVRRFRISSSLDHPGLTLRLELLVAHRGAPGVKVEWSDERRNVTLDGIRLPPCYAEETNILMIEDGETELVRVIRVTFQVGSFDAQGVHFADELGKVQATERQEGDPCPVCGETLTKEPSKRSNHRRGQHYYYAWYLKCPGCNRMFMTEGGKRFLDEPLQIEVSEDNLIDAITDALSQWGDRNQAEMDLLKKAGKIPSTTQLARVIYSKLAEPKWSDSPPSDGFHWCFVPDKGTMLVQKAGDDLRLCTLQKTDLDKTVPGVRFWGPLPAPDPDNNKP